MKQQISLNPSTDTIHVDDVRVEDGVYFKTKPECIDEGMKSDCWIWFLVKKGDELVSVSPKNLNEKWNSYKSLPDAIKYESDADFFTLSGLRIVTEKPLGVQSLRNTDHIGFIDDTGKRGYILAVANNKFISVATNETQSLCNSRYGDEFHDSLCDALAISVVSYCHTVAVYRFTTAQELHKWLGED